MNAEQSDKTIDEVLAEINRKNELIVLQQRERIIAEERAIKVLAEAEARRKVEVTKRNDVRPYADELAQEICERIAVGELLINICLDEHIPTMIRCNQWLHEHSEFNELYLSAISDRLSVFEEEVIAIADDMSRDFRTVIKNGKEKRVPDPDMVARAKLRNEVRFEHLKAGRPAKWGDVSTLITKSDDPFDTSNMSPEELERQIADIELKSRKSKAA